ncbi:dynamin family protein [Corynebacterium hansenii]|uniref:Dynamin family protein n=1 Tax=Corynebacterium hansenii TaxID=394964 RepID=A0ABV7ZQS4_9CORY|nr:dynamin family protein [Corynebacterium hansenii]WJZ01054.1 Isoniazid-induced protein IniA [Corynebacterium hansenii]
MTKAMPSTPLEKASALLDHVIDQVLLPYGYASECDVARERFSAASQQKTVVVVGEVSRGKSALASALVGMPGASPQGVGLTTSTAIALGPESEALQSGMAELFYPDRAVAIPHGELAAHVTSPTASVPGDPAEDRPTRAFVAVSDSAMGDAIVIDTPGVGGINSDHAGLAVTNARQATILVVTVDASTPITKPEMDFIRTTGSEIGSVIVAVTKTDKHATGFRSIAEQNRELLLAHVGRELPVIPVSSVMATYESPDPGDMELMRSFSGIGDLREAIFRRLANAENLPAINGLRVAAATLQKLKAKLEEELAVVEQGAGVVPKLAQDLDELKALKREMEQWEHYLGRDLTLLRQKVALQLDSELDRIRQSWSERISKSGMKVLRKNPQYFTSLMEAEFNGAVVSALTAYTDELRTEIVEPRFKSELVWRDIEEDIKGALLDRELRTSSVKSKREGIVDPMMLMMGVSGGTMIGTALATVVSFAGLGLIAGVGWVAFNVGFKAMRTGKNNLVTWIRETTVTTKQFTSRLIDSVAASARPAIVLRYRAQLREATEDLQRQIRVAEAQAERDGASRKRSLERLKKNHAVVVKSILRVERMIEVLEQDAVPESPGADDRGGAR